MTSTLDPYRPNLLPSAIRAYLAGHDPNAPDLARAATAFAGSAVVRDDGASYAGTSEISAWLSKTSTEFSFTTTFTGQAQLGEHEWVIVKHLEGDFPGGVVDLTHRFVLENDRIAALTIAA